MMHIADPLAGSSRGWSRMSLRAILLRSDKLQMHFHFHTYFRVIRQVLADKPNPKRLAIHIGLLGTLSIWSLVNAVFLGLDRIFYPRFEQEQIEKPVFIVGNARSGTTFLHRVLCGDEQRFVHFRTWELLCPSLLQKKLIRGAMSALQRFFPGAFARLVAWEERQFPELKKQHPIGINKPEEDELLMLMSFSSVMLAVLFPYFAELPDIMCFERRPEADRKRLLQFYRRCVQRKLYEDGGVGAYGTPRTLLSKNPGFVSKMRDLAVEFPDAKFIYLVRNPFETVPSVLKLLRTVWEGLGLDDARIEAATQGLLEGCIRDYFYALEVLDELPPERRAIVQYADLVADPKATVEQVYERLELTISPEFEERLAAERTRQKKYHSTNAYSLEQFGIDPEELAEWLAPVLERFGFSSEGLPVDESKELL
jgi:hypothetical protein